MTGDDVKKVQVALVSNRFTRINISITGTFDAATEAAVEQFQSATGNLVVDGAVGSETLKALKLIQIAVAG